MRNCFWIVISLALFFASAIFFWMAVVLFFSGFRWIVFGISSIVIMINCLVFAFFTLDKWMKAVRRQAQAQAVC